MDIITQTKAEYSAEIRERRREALLQMSVRYLARAGKSISAAYSTPTPALQYVK